MPTIKQLKQFINIKMYGDKSKPLTEFIPEKRTSRIGKILDFVGLYKTPKAFQYWGRNNNE